MIDYESKRALIIEDFPEFARSLRSMLNDIGLENVDVVNTGESAIRACTEAEYDIILSDYNLGHGKNGMQVLEELHHTDQLKPDTVFIMTTAENTTAMVMGAIENQPDAYLTKPFNGVLLQSRLNKLVTKKDTLSPILYSIKKGKINQALELCDKLTEEYPKYKMSIIKLKAECFMKKRKYAESIQIYEDILASRPVPWAMVGLAQAQIAHRDYDNAIILLKETITKFPMVLEAYDMLADCQYKKEEFEEAQKTLENAIKKSPQVVKRQNHLGEIALKNQDFETSIKSYKNSIRISKNSIFRSPDNYINLANSASQQIAVDPEANHKKLVTETQGYLKEFYTEYKDDKVCKLRGSVAESVFYKAQGAEKESQQCLRDAKQVFSTLETMLPAESGLEIAKGMQELGEAEVAEEILKDVVQHNFENTQFLEKALPFLKDSSIIEKGKQAHKLNSQGIKLFEQKQFDEAVKCFEKAIEMSPKNVSIILNTVQVLLKVYQSSQSDASLIDKCVEYLNSINTMSPDDHRFNRYSELLRLTRIIHQENF